MFRPCACITYSETVRSRRELITVCAGDSGLGHIGKLAWNPQAGVGSGGQGETLFQALPSPSSLPPESPLQQLREEGACSSPPWRSLPLGSPIRLHASSPSSPCAHILPRTLRTAPLLRSFGHEAPGRGRYLQAEGRGRLEPWVSVSEEMRRRPPVECSGSSSLTFSPRPTSRSQVLVAAACLGRVPSGSLSWHLV